MGEQEGRVVCRSALASTDADGELMVAGEFDIDLPPVTFSEVVPGLWVGISAPFERPYLIVPEWGILRPATDAEIRLDDAIWHGTGEEEVRRRFAECEVSKIPGLTVDRLAGCVVNQGARFVAVSAFEEFWSSGFFVFGVVCPDGDRRYWLLEDCWDEPPAVDSVGVLLERLTRIGVFAKPEPID